MSALPVKVDTYQSSRGRSHVTSARMFGDKVVTLDVREDLAKGREPLGRIMHAVERLEDDESLLLIAPFQPAPLFSVMAAEGFSHRSRETASGDWEVLFSRTRETKLTSASSRACSQSPRLSPACCAMRSVAKSNKSSLDSLHAGALTDRTDSPLRRPCPQACSLVPGANRRGGFP